MTVQELNKLRDQYEREMEEIAKWVLQMHNETAHLEGHKLRIERAKWMKRKDEEGGPIYHAQRFWYKRVLGEE